MKTVDVIIRDPFVLPVGSEGEYYLYGTNHTMLTEGGAWKGFFCYRSGDLENWEGPIPVFMSPLEFEGTVDFWAPEVHEYQGEYYLFATFLPKNANRGTWILRADRPEGPFSLWSDGAVTPRDWVCLDGTLHWDADGAPWMVFCHEWVQITDGTVCAVPLSPDLREAAGEAVTLFSATDAPWVRPISNGAFVTDGPFLFREEGVLKMIWSSFGDHGYAMGMALSESGSVTGPWRQFPEPVFKADGGHGMRFTRFDGKTMLTVHQPNRGNVEHPVFFDYSAVTTDL